MGNTLGLKITKIGECNLLKDVVFAQDKKVLPYLHYIVKINKFYVENFIKGSIIREFTIKDVVREKEFTIAIERVESGLFFDGLGYLLEQVPKLERVLFISNVLYDSPSNIKGVRAGQTILLGNEKRYFDSLDNVEQEILSNNAKFLFYDFIDEKVYYIDFEEFRDSNSGLKMGFECEVRLLREIFDNQGGVILKERMKNNCDLLNLNANQGINLISKNVCENKNFFLESKNEILIKEKEDKIAIPESNNDIMNENEMENSLNQKMQINNDTTNQPVNSKNSSDVKSELTTNENSEDSDKKLDSENNKSILINHSLIDTNLIENQIESKKISSSNFITTPDEKSPKNNNANLDLLNQSLSPKTVDQKMSQYTISIEKEDEKINLNPPQEEEIVDTSKQENIQQNTNLIEISTLPKYTNNQSLNNELIKKDIISPTFSNIADSILSNTSTLGDLDVARGKNYKYTLTKGKEKYNKFLSIYEKIDSNFNFMNINKKIAPRSPRETDSENENENEEICLSHFEKENGSITKSRSTSSLFISDNISEKEIKVAYNNSIILKDLEVTLNDNEKENSNINTNYTNYTNNFSTLNTLNTLNPSLPGQGPSTLPTPTRPSLNKNSRVILIKGFYLPTSDLRIQNLSDNTSNYNTIINK
jgi:hypothetical protein